MNEKQFDANLKSAFKAPEMPIHMDHKINEKLAQATHRTLVKRKLTLSLGAAAAVASGVFLFPPIKAQASLGGMMNALDKKLSAKIITFSVDESGNRQRIGTTVIANGNVAVLGPNGETRQVEMEMDSFVWDPMTKAYIKFPRRGGGGIRLSELLGPASKFSFGKKVQLDRVEVNGRKILQAIITDQNLPERYIIEAEPETQLPFHMATESLEQGKWRIRQDLDFTYEQNLRVDKPDFAAYELVTPEQNAQKLTNTLTQEVLGKVVAKDKTILVRKIDVAEDGSVFIAYQSGKTSGGTWTGYQLSLSDNLGTSYLRAGDIMSNNDKDLTAPKDGVIELEIFVPVKRVASSTARSLTVSVALTSKGNIEKLVPYEGNNLTQSSKSKVVKLFSKDFSSASCSVRPTWSAGIDWMLYHDVYAEIFKAQWRSINAIRVKDWNEAERQLNEQLRWKRESEQQGLSSWEMGTTKEQLEMVKKHITP